MNNTCWPQLELTDEEKVFAAPYKEAKKSGVMRRFYRAQLVKTLVTGEANKLTDRLNPSGRYTKVFAMTFTGDIEHWRIRVTSAAGEQYIAGGSTVSTYTSVTALLNTPAVATTYNGAGTTAETMRNLSFVLTRPTYQPLGFDPNIVLIGAQSLIVDGEFVDARSNFVTNSGSGTAVPGGDRSILNICFHVWEMESPDGPAVR